MRQTSCRLIGLGAALAVFAVLVRVSDSAPKQSSMTTPAGGASLQPLFDASSFSGVTGEPRQDSEGRPLGILYRIDIEQNLQIVVEELPTGYAWVWCSVAAFEKDPPFGLYRAVAELNDQSRWGALSWGKNAEGKGGQVYLNYFFLVRTADTQALESYIDTAVSHQEHYAEQLTKYRQ